ncbi:MAG: FtsX-like permease family protein, partial [Bryobacteraceae bacterium]
VAGRDYTWTDIAQMAPLAIISENLAKEYWGSASAAVGRRIRETPDSPWREVIGVVGDVRDDGVDRAAPMSLYWPAIARDFQGRKIQIRRGITYAIRTPRAGAQSLVNEIRQAVWSVNPDLPLERVRTLEDLYRQSMARTSFALVMLALAGGMSLLLGVIGIYGVISYSVSQRTREIGIRMALGAEQPALLRMFVGHGLKLVAIGLVAGLVGAYALTKSMSSILYGVNAADPLTYIGVSLVLAAAAALASYIPSRRAMAVDPVEALRAE